MPRKAREPLWLERSILDAIHLDQLREHGGLPGVRDENALESALARPQNLFGHGETKEVPVLAAAYAWGIARNHPYRDGNKRAAFLALAVFAELNGFRFEAPEEEVVQVMLAVADKRCSEADLVMWVRRSLRKIKAS